MLGGVVGGVVFYLTFTPVYRITFLTTHIRTYISGTRAVLILGEKTEKKHHKEKEEHPDETREGLPYTRGSSSLEILKISENR